MAESELNTLVDATLDLPEQIEKVLNTENKIKDFAQDFKTWRTSSSSDVAWITPSRSKGRLKLKEISYIHAEAYAAGELKHGTLALIIEGVPVFALATQADLYEKMLSNIKEVKARDATVVALGRLAGDLETAKSVDYVLHIPRTHPMLTPIL